MTVRERGSAGGSNGRDKETDIIITGASVQGGANAYKLVVVGLLQAAAPEERIAGIQCLPILVGTYRHRGPAPT